MIAPGVFADAVVEGKDPKGKLIFSMGHKTQKNQSWYYAGRFLRLKAAADLLPIYSRASDPIKEMSEIWGIWEGIRKTLSLNPKDKNIRAVVVGDGNTPRLGAFLACLTQWNVLSFDPAFDKGAEYVRWDWVRNLDARAITLENIQEAHEDKETLIVLPHAHASAELSLAKFKSSLPNKTHLISMPCCLIGQQTLKEKPCLRYIDKYIMSDKNEMFVWKNL